MLLGEVEVQQAHLNTFLAVAERLRVRGLCQSGGKSSPIPSSNNRPGASVSPQPPTSHSNNTSHPTKSSSSSHHHRRRSSLEPLSSSGKRAKIESDIAIKEESLHQQHHDRRHEDLGQAPPNPNADHDPSGGSHHDDGSLLSRSGHGSEADYTEYGYGGGNGAGPSGGRGGVGVGRVRDGSERTGDEDEEGPPPGGDYQDGAGMGTPTQLMGKSINTVHFNT